jgi:hypothetical protein
MKMNFAVPEEFPNRSQIQKFLDSIGTHEISLILDSTGLSTQLIGDGRKKNFKETIKRLTKDGFRHISA